MSTGLETCTLTSQLIPEVPRHFKTRRPTLHGPKPNTSSGGWYPNSIARSNTALDSGANRVMRNNTASGKGSGKGRQPRRGKGSVESFWANRNGSVTDAMVDRISNAVHQQVTAIQNAGVFQVSAIRGVARAIRDGIMCMHFALYMTALCMIAVALNYAYVVSSGFTDEVRARYMIFGLGLMPGLIVHLCPTLTRIRGHVQST